MVLVQKERCATWPGNDYWIETSIFLTCWRQGLLKRVAVQSSLFGSSVAGASSFVGSFSQVGRNVETTEKSHTTGVQTCCFLQQYSYTIQVNTYTIKQWILLFHSLTNWKFLWITNRFTSWNLETLQSTGQEKQIWLTAFKVQASPANDVYVIMKISKLSIKCLLSI